MVVNFGVCQHGVVGESCVIFERSCWQRILTSVMSSSSRDDVERARRIVQIVWVGDVVLDRRDPLRIVYVSREDNVDIVLDEKRFESSLTLSAWLRVGVPRSVSKSDDPRGQEPVD